jgi:hydrogenase assembly chaperone HypC/HupF
MYGVPARIVTCVDPESNVAEADIAGVRHKVSLALVGDSQPGDWVLVSADVALNRIDEQQARRARALLGAMTPLFGRLGARGELQANSVSWYRYHSVMASI